MKKNIMQKLTTIFITTGLLFAFNCKDEDGAAFFPVVSGDDSSPTVETIPGSSGSAEVTQETNDKETDGTFNFETSNSVDLDITVNDANGPVEGAIVVVDENGTILYQGVTDNAGNASGTFETDSTVEEVTIQITAGGETVTQTVSVDGIAGIDRDLTFEGDTGSGTLADSDGDGIPDDSDAYPQDSSRATITLKPASGESVVAYEDLFPSPGDADFNDYVVKVSNEEDLNAAGKVVRIRGRYDHIAKGAGYNHFLRLKLPVSASVNVKRYTADGTLESDTTTAYAALSSVEILDRSDRTLSQKNTDTGQSFKTGKYAEVEIIFDTPVESSQLGSAPYDLYIYVANTGKEIHFPGRYYDGDGKDLYMDSNGFPWALRVPEAWNWPYERDNIENGYPEFDDWYLSMGTTNKDWYTNSDPAHVFPYVTDGALAAYVRAGFRDSSFLWTLLAMAIAGLTVLFLYRKRAESGL